MKQLFVIVAREPEAAVLAVFEAREQRFGERARQLEILPAKPRLHHFDNRHQQIRVVVEIGIERREAIAARCVQAAVAPCRSRQRIEGRDGEIGPPRLVLSPRRARQARDRQGVPGCQHLVVAAWMDALLANGE